MSEQENERGGATLGGGRLHTRDIVFLVLAAAAPMAAVVLTMPTSIGFGNGAGTPGTFVLAGVTLLLFATGYSAMSRHIVNTGAFYSYIRTAFGPVAGTAAAYVAVVAYNCMTIAATAAFGYFMHLLLASDLHIISIPWQVLSGAGLVAVALLGYREILLSAEILGVALSLEVLALAVLDVAVLVNKGPAAYSLTTFSPGVVFGGATGVSVMYAFAAYVGFEATAIYGEEAREPHKTVPRATYIAICIIAVFYGLTAWSLVAAYGVDNVVKAAQGNPSGLVFAADHAWVGAASAHVLEVLICTSLFAAMVAFHNASARYMFALGRDRVLPRRIGAAHHKHGSPHVASVVQIAITAIVVTIFALAGSDPFLIGTAVPLGLGTFGIILLQAGAAYSVVAFFRRRRDHRVFTTLVAPALAALSLTVATILVITNFDALTGSTSPIVGASLWVFAVAAVLGAGVALYTRRSDPLRYAQLGAGRRQPAETSLDEDSLGLAAATLEPVS